MEIAAGELKAKCLKLMDEVQQTDKEIVITKHGRAIARWSVQGRESTRSWCLAGTVHLQRDVILPVGEAWNADS